jgi:hypothetical protein
MPPSTATNAAAMTDGLNRIAPANIVMKTMPPPATAIRPASMNLRQLSILAASSSTCSSSRSTSSCVVVHVGITRQQAESDRTLPVQIVDLIISERQVPMPFVQPPWKFRTGAQSVSALFMRRSCLGRDLATTFHSFTSMIECRGPSRHYKV